MQEILPDYRFNWSRELRLHSKVGLHGGGGDGRRHLLMPEPKRIGQPFFFVFVRTLRKQPGRLGDRWFRGGETKHEDFGPKCGRLGFIRYTHQKYLNIYVRQWRQVTFN